MYDTEYDLTINDEEVMALSDNMCRKLEIYKEWLQHLINLLDRIEEQSITDGKTADNLAYLNRQTHLLDGEADEIQHDIKTTLQQYLEEIESADGSFYESESASSSSFSYYTRH